jgi:glycosyltransferase involved in cell wall biosynthesis
LLIAQIGEFLRILYIASSFPEPSKGDTIYTDLAEALSASGHVLTVVVSEESKNKSNPQMQLERGFEVLRIKTGNYYDVGLLEKGITTIKIPILMKRGISEQLGDRGYDLILFEAPPVTVASLVDWAKRKFDCPAYLMLKDIFPQNAVDLGIIKENGLLFRYFKAKEKKLYNTADIIGCMSNANKEYIITHNPWLDKKKVNIFPNTKKVTDDYCNDGYPMRDLYDISHDACLFLYGGNMGKPQYLDLLARMIIEFKDDKSIFFLFVGRGTDTIQIRECN